MQAKHYPDAHYFSTPSPSVPVLLNRLKSECCAHNFNLYSQLIERNSSKLINNFNEGNINLRSAALNDNLKLHNAGIITPIINKNNYLIKQNNNKLNFIIN